MKANLLNEDLLKTLGEDKNSLKELNKRIENKTFKFDNTNTSQLYVYLYACNKFEELDTLHKLIKDKNFIELLDKSDITGSMLVSLTNVFKDNRMTLLKNSSKVKESILKGDELLNTEDILDDLSKKEIITLREDIAIDNYLITNGIRFDALKEETKNQILKDYSLLSIYNNRVIIEFTNSLEKELKTVANDPKYLEIYLKALNNNYVIVDKIFEYITVDTLNSILEKKPSFEIIYHLVRSANDDIKEELLKNSRVIELLNVCQDSNVLESLPNLSKVYILSQRKNLLDRPSSDILYALPKKDITKLFRINLYPQFIDALNNKKDINYKLLVSALPTDLLTDLIDNKLEELNIESVIELTRINPTLLKAYILKKKRVCLNLAASIKQDDCKNLVKLFEIGWFNPDEKIKFVTNCESLKNSDLLLELISLINVNYRKNIYENPNIMSKIITSENFILDEYTKAYLLSNEDELLQVKANILVEIINGLTIEEANKLLENDKILEKLFKENKDNIANMIFKVNKKELLTLFTKDFLIKYYNRDNVQNILDILPLKEKKNIFVNKIQQIVFGNDEELIKIYKALENKNSLILNTLYLNFMMPNIKGVKISVLERITQSRELQEILYEIMNKKTLSMNGIVTALNICDKFDINTIIALANIYKDSSFGINRKIIGNIPKMINEVDINSLAKNDIKNILSYMLYLIPRYYDKKAAIERPIVVKTPSTYDDIKTYENRLEEITSLNITKNDNILENFLIRHFKITTKEAKIQLQRYNINRVDAYVYRDEVDYLNNLNKLLNTDNASLKEMDSTYPIISMFDSFMMESKIKEMYGKIYNYEIKTRANSNKFIIEKLYGKEIKINECNNEFLFLINKTNIEEEFYKTNSYLEAWHNTLNNSSIYASLVSNESLKPFDEFYFGFNGVLDSGINLMSLYDIKDDCTSSSKITFYHPFELIDNTRYDNTIVIDKFAVRPNYNNSNLPYVEPDFIVVNLSRVSDHTYLEKVVRASEDFKTKRNKNGLPIVGIDFNKLTDNELDKIDKMITRYNKTKDMVTLRSIITTFENNYSSYVDSEYNTKFNTKEILELLKRRIPKSNSIKELEYLLNSFKEEYNKFYNNDCNYDIKDIEKLIEYRIDELNS